MMALSQFVEPYSAEQVQGFIQKKESRGKTLAQWELDAYNFKPLTPQELLELSSNDLSVARYVRAACIRINTSSLTQRSINRGRLSTPNFEFIFNTVFTEDKIKQYQNRLLKSEQGIRVKEALEFIQLICEVEKPILELASYNMVKATKYYIKAIDKLPKINGPKDLPKLQEISFVKDSKGEIIGAYSRTDTTKINGETLVSRRNRRRLPVRVIPEVIKKALVAVEDRRFWNFKPPGSKGFKGHKGVDLLGIMRAIEAVGSDKVQGASTITMQLAKNLLLREDVFKEHHFGKRSALRKLNEYILVNSLEKSLSKDEILEWYLNTVYFGRRSEGIVMAARSYFGKELEALKKEEVAFLVGLPKSPNTLDPQFNYDGALLRRNIVLNQMAKEKYITAAEKKSLKATPIVFKKREKVSQKQAYAHFYTSAVEKQMKDWLKSFGKNPNLGFDITVPINHTYQKWAVESLQKGLLKFERSKNGKRHLTVKPSEDRLPNIRKQVEKLASEKNISTLAAFPEVLKKVSPGYVDASQFKIGVILSDTKIGLPDGSQVNRQPGDRRGKLLKIVDGIKRNLEIWDTVLLQQFSNSKGGMFYRIASFTKIQGGIVVLDNKSGAVLATSGGFSVGAGQRYKGAAGQRAFSAYRQPGSTVKPFTYLYALSRGVLPSDNISNADVAFPDKIVDGDRICDGKKWIGNLKEASSSSMRNGLIKSRNRTTLHTFAKAMGLLPVDGGYLERGEALTYGINQLLGLMQRFGLYTDREQICYSALLGGEETTVVEMAGAYGALANGGVYNTPYTINHVSRRGKKAMPFKLNSKVDKGIRNAIAEASNQRAFNSINRLRPIMQGVVQRGTARSMSKWADLIAGKTGTTNSNKDTWFVGFNKEITVAVWVGYPDNTTLGSRSEGGNTALPIFKSFMEEYYKKFPEKLKNKFVTVRGQVEPRTGFALSEQFQNDYNHFTGTQNKLRASWEYYASDADKTSQAKPYNRHSIAAGDFFFDNLSEQYRAWYQNEFDKAQLAKQRVSQAGARHTAEMYTAARAYCIKYRVEFPRNTYVQVDKACTIMEEYNEDRAAQLAQASEESGEVKTLREYFLERGQFNQ